MVRARASAERHGAARCWWVRSFVGGRHGAARCGRGRKPNITVRQGVGGCAASSEDACVGRTEGRREKKSIYFFTLKHTCVV